MRDNALPRILPFALFMGFIGIEGGLNFLQGRGLVAISDTMILSLYPIKTVCVAGVILFYWKHYREIIWRDVTDLKMGAISISGGLLIFALWITLDFNFATQGTPSGFNPGLFENDVIRFTMIAVRLAGAALLVPIMEELFWRSFLIRYVVTSDFSRTTIGTFTWPSFLITALLFGLEHHYILAGVVAGIIFNLILYYTKSIFQCILAHSVANLALGAYVLLTGEWQFW
ncbi:MAG: CAAX prenyl protease-related protein [Desulfuromonadales bacterium]|nr:CAAX prenyl protease-related protein [Desulfuromonadales bacterium]